MGGGEVQTQASPSVAINLKGSAKYVAVSTNAESVMAMASLVADGKLEESSKRAPLDLVCVIDRSGSMAGDKLRLVKETMKFVLRQLRSHDRFALISYDTNVVTNIRLTTMDAKGIEAANLAIDGLRAGSATNLSGGLFEGLSLVDHRENPAAVCSVLLFTDGLANEGIKDKDSLKTALAKRMETTTSASVYTFGFGSDLDATMLQMIAEVGHGLYYFIDGTDKIPLAFADALGGLQSVVAQNIKLTIAPLGAEMAKVFKGTYTMTGTVPVASGASIKLELGDMFDGENKDILFLLNLPAIAEPQPEPIVIAALSIDYFNVIDASDQHFEATITIARPADAPAVGDRPINELLELQENRIRAAEAITESRTFAESGDFVSARIRLQSAKAEILSTNSSSVPYARRMVAELEEMETVDMSSSEQYTRTGSSNLAQRGMAYQVQRSNRLSYTDDVDVFETPSKKASKIAYKSAK